MCRRRIHRRQSARAAGVRAREGVVAAGVEHQDVGVRGRGLEHRHHLLHVEALLAHVGGRTLLRVHRQQVVAPVDLHAMAGVVQQRLGAARLQPLGQLRQGLLHALAAGVVQRQHLEAQPAQQRAHRLGVAHRIDQRGHAVGRVADDQRHAGRAGGGGIGAVQPGGEAGGAGQRGLFQPATAIGARMFTVRRAGFLCRPSRAISATAPGSAFSLASRCRASGA
jgi:hypothetical protein